MYTCRIAVLHEYCEVWVKIQSNSEVIHQVYIIKKYDF